MYEYVDGKVDWMAYGLPVEGEDGPFLGDGLGEAPTCDVGGTVGDARKVLEGVADGGDGGNVLVLSDGLVVGEVDAAVRGGAADDAPLIDVMRPVPSTVRPSVTMSSLAGAGGGPAVVTDSSGRLLGLAVVEAAPGIHDDEGHDHGHDHEGHDHGGGDDEAYEQEMAEVMQALQERFGGQEPSAEEVHEFLRDRLVAEGKTLEEAEQLLREMEGGGD